MRIRIDIRPLGSGPTNTGRQIKLLDATLFGKFLLDLADFIVVFFKVYSYSLFCSEILHYIKISWYHTKLLNSIFNGHIKN